MLVAKSQVAFVGRCPESVQEFTVAGWVAIFCTLVGGIFPGFDGPNNLSQRRGGAEQYRGCFEYLLWRVAPGRRSRDAVEVVRMFFHPKWRRLKSTCYNDDVS